MKYMTVLYFFTEFIKKIQISINIYIVYQQCYL